MTGVENIDRPVKPAHGKKVYGTFALLFVFALAAWLGTMQWKEHLTVSGIIVEGEHILTKEEVVKLAQVSQKTKNVRCRFDLDSKKYRTESFRKKCGGSKRCTCDNQDFG